MNCQAISKFYKHTVLQLHLTTCCVVCEINRTNESKMYSLHMIVVRFQGTVVGFCLRTEFLFVPYDSLGTVLAPCFILTIYCTTCFVWV